MATQYTGPGPADSKTSPPSFLHVQVHVKIIIVNLFLQNSRHALGVHFYSSSVCSMSVELMWASLDLLFIPSYRTVHDLYSVGTGTLKADVFTFKWMVHFKYSTYMIMAAQSLPTLPVNRKFISETDWEPRGPHLHLYLPRLSPAINSDTGL